MTSQDEEISRGQRVERLLSEPLLQEAFETVEARLARRWRESDLSQTERREACFQMLRALDEIRGHLQSVLETGKLASIQREQEEEP